MTEQLTPKTAAPSSDMSASMTTPETTAPATGSPVLQVLRDQRKTIGVALVLVVGTYWIAGQLDRWTLAGCIAAGVGLGLGNHLATELWLLVVNHPYNDRRARQRRRFRNLWQVRIMWTGMAPVYMKACVQALIGGRRRKPIYKVTRKQDDLRWHWRHTLPHTTVALLVLFGGLDALRYSPGNTSLETGRLGTGAACSGWKG